MSEPIDTEYAERWLSLNPRKCKKPQCGYEGKMTFSGGSGDNYAKIICPQCGKYQDWMPSPESKNRPAAHKKATEKHVDRNGYCEICNRHASELQPGDYFVGHHIREFAQGGSADASNIQTVCKSCHDWIHWRRRQVKLERPQRSALLENIEAIIASL